MTDDTPNVAAMIEDPDRYVYCDNVHFDDVRNCELTSEFFSKIYEDLEKGMTCGTGVLGPRQVHCN